MGFFIKNNYELTEYGISLNNLYVSIKGSYNIYKKDENLYMITAYYHFFGSKSQLKELRRVFITLETNNIEENIFNQLYSYIKENEFKDCELLDE